MFIDEYTYITIKNSKPLTKWEKKLGYLPKLNEPIKVHWKLLKPTSYRTLFLKVKCDDCGIIYDRRIRDMTETHLCKKCINKGELNYMYGKKPSEKNINATKKWLKENGNPFTWESCKKKIKEKQGWLIMAEKNRGKKRSEETKRKMSESMIKSYELGISKPNKQWGNVRTRQYKGIDYQSSYELNFLKYMENNNKLELVDRGPRIKYMDIDGKCRNYFIDYKIKNTNIVIEIKSTYIWNKHKNTNKQKQKSANKLFEYLLIMDNDFSLLKNKI